MEIALQHISGILQASNTILALARQISRAGPTSRVELFEQMRSARDELNDEIDLAAAAFDVDQAIGLAHELAVIATPVLESIG